MTKAEVVRNEAGEYTGFRVFDHAGYADSGEDIVCAAVSILVINTANAIKALTRNPISLRSDKKKGLIEARFPEGLDANGRLLMDAMCMGLLGIKEEYGDHLSYSEVSAA